MRMLRSALVVFLLGLIATPVAAAPIVIDFEGLLELEPVGVLSGVTFEGAVVLTAGSTLNELDYPPRSGVNAVLNLLSEMRLVFDDEVSNVGGHFTYGRFLPDANGDLVLVSGRVTMSAFDSSNNLLGVATSISDWNFNGSGNPDPNELLTISAQAIAYVTIASAFGPEGFFLDDLSFEVAEDGGGGDPNPVPEPATVSLVLLGAAVAAGRQKLRARRQARV